MTIGKPLDYLFQTTCQTPIFPNGLSNLAKHPVAGYRTKSIQQHSVHPKKHLTTRALLNCMKKTLF
jgi:hypothetical protein